MIKVELISAMRTIMVANTRITIVSRQHVEL
jgi:hypothetical protein